MKHLFLNVVILCTLLACSNSQNVTYQYSNDQKYRIVEVPVVIESDTTFVNEIRFYKISSARNAGQVMYDQFGKWDQQLESKHGSRQYQHVWENRALLQDANQFTIIADGYEGSDDYFSSVTVFDRDNNDCLDVNHPSYVTIIDKLTHLMKNRDKENYKYYEF